MVLRFNEAGTVIAPDGGRFILEIGEMSILLQ